MILKKKVFGSAMLAAAIMSAGTCTAMAAPQQENTAIEAESENSTQTAAGLALKITEGFQNADEQASIEKKEVEVVKASEEEPQDEWQNRLMANVEESLNVRTEASEESALAAAYESKEDEHLEEVLIEKNNPWCEQRIRELNLPQNQLIALVKRGEENLIPSGSTKIHEGDIVVLYR